MLNAAAEKGDWGKPLPAGRASRHRAVHGLWQLFGRDRRSLGEQEGQAEGAPHGAGARTAATPSTRSQIAAQVEGSVAYGLSATLYGEMVVDKGRVTNINFDTYEIMRLAEMPKVETVIVPTYDFWGGVGEPTICVVAPAVLNAIHRRDRQAGAQPAAEEREAGVMLGALRVVSRRYPLLRSDPAGRGDSAQLFNTTHAPPAFCSRVQISVAASRVAAGMRTR